MAEYWTSFVRTGVAVAKGEPAWEPLHSDDKVLRFEPDKVGYFDAGKQHNCAFWKEPYPDILTR